MKFFRSDWKLFVIILISIVERNVLGDTLNSNLTNNSSKPSSTQQTPQCNIKLNKITGSIHSLQYDDISKTQLSLMHTKILVNHGQYIGYPREDGTFEIDDLPPDSYVVEVTHPKFIYESARVDITSKGKIRARRVNYIQPSIVQTIDYPLVFKPKNLHNYFLARETWRVMDLLFNPVVLMMVVPLVIIWLLPKLMSPQESQTQRESMQMPEYNVPELSEMMASMFGRQGQSTASTNQGSSTGGNQAITSSSGGGGGSTSTKHSKARRRN